ncbi:MAG: hypothetical protein JO168_05460 [Solirubrobacterales bacterium]|nr:hypothetical protein [Solirubrobacterales bacterium]
MPAATGRPTRDGARDNGDTIEKGLSAGAQRKDLMSAQSSATPWLAAAGRCAIRLHGKAYRECVETAW